MTTIVYATRNDVRMSLDVSMTYSNQIIDSKLRAATRSVEGLLGRRFYPELKTMYYDWPNDQRADVGQLWLGSDQLIAVTSLIAGGVTIPPTDYFLRRLDNKDEPPYSLVEINRATSSAFSSGTTSQRAIAITGVYGDKDTSTALSSAQISTGINDVVTSLVVAPLDGHMDVYPGSLILMGTERALVTEHRMSATGYNLLNTITAQKSDNAITVTDGTKFAVDETILIESERMRIVDIAGNILTVRRAWDGSTLAAHVLGAGSPIYALRSLTIARGVLGSTAAAHLATVPIYCHAFPALINELTNAEAITMLQQASSGYARQVGSGANARSAAGKGLEDLRNQAVQAHAWHNRWAAV